MTDVAKNYDKAERRKEKLKARVTEIDLIRGICVILMVIDHMFYDLFGVLPEIFLNYPPTKGFWSKAYDFSIDYWVCDARVVARFVVIAFFLVLTGICCSFSRSNFKRGLKLFGVAMLVTLATFVAGKIMGDSELLITFGILHCISLAILLCSLIEVFTQKWYVYAVIGGLMIIVGIFLSDFNEYYYSDVPNVFVAVLRQIVGRGMFGSDSYSFLIFGGQVVLGVAAGKFLYPERKPLLFKKGYSDNVVTFIGRHALLVYVAHQLIIPVLLGLSSLFAALSYLYKRRKQDTINKLKPAEKSS